jgi:hypothetical protein
LEDFLILVCPMCSIWLSPTHSIKF